MKNVPGGLNAEEAILNDSPHIRNCLARTPLIPYNKTMSEESSREYKQTLDYYNTQAAEAFRLYTSKQSPFKGKFSQCFPPRSKILDMGSGSGRDVKSLLDQDYDAYGIDASIELVKLAKLSLLDQSDRIQEGSLPDNLPADIQEDDWDGILCSAVFQHIPDNHLFDSTFTIHRLLRMGGRLLLTIPIAYPDINNDRDPKGRLFRIRPVEEYIFLFERIGFELISQEERSDSLNRDQLSWGELLFQKKNLNGIRAIDKIESFIREDAKVSSYKFALLRALGETASTSARMASWQSDGTVHIPIEPIIHKWIEYYWPLLLTDDGKRIYQGQKIEGKKDITFRTELESLIQYWEEKGDGWRKFKGSLERESFTEIEQRLYQETVKKIRTALLNGPVKYMGNIKTGPVFENHKKEIGLPADLWSEFSMMGRWFEDSLMLRWAEFCANISNQPEGVNSSLILSRMLSMNETARNVSLSKSIYDRLEQKTELHCVWSDTRLSSYDLDHAIPYSLWRNNALWNLFPADKKVNNSKRDKLPERLFLKSRESRIRGYWDMCYETEPLLFEKELKSLTGNSNFSKKISLDIFRQFCEQVEVLALQNVVERWQT
ncbi:methyltransferase domain-containing protein [Oceanispirochaeta sp. M1]|nr:methyltransferase domain-containing protein [Oceanispirochaeta sp. M1]